MLLAECVRSSWTLVVLSRDHDSAPYCRSATGGSERAPQVVGWAERRTEGLPHSAVPPNAREALHSRLPSTYTSPLSPESQASILRGDEQEGAEVGWGAEVRAVHVLRRHALDVDELDTRGLVRAESAGARHVVRTAV